MIRREKEAPSVLFGGEGVFSSYWLHQPINVPHHRLCHHMAKQIATGKH